jgi:hypothetical protein
VKKAIPSSIPQNSETQNYIDSLINHSKQKFSPAIPIQAPNTTPQPSSFPDLLICQTFDEFKIASFETIKQKLGSNYVNYITNVNYLKTALDLNSFVKSASELIKSLSNWKSKNKDLIPYIDILINYAQDKFLKTVSFI